MDLNNPLYSALGVDGNNRESVLKLSRKLKVSVKKLDYFNDNNVLPDNQTLNSIKNSLDISKEFIMLKMGIYDTELKKKISEYAPFILENLNGSKHNVEEEHKHLYSTNHGDLYQGDCLSLLSNIEDEKFDLIFADPPFNLNKVYPSGINDNLSKIKYIYWTELWLKECIRTLKQGGSLFLWNIPKWNSYFSEFLNHRLTFKHWIAVDIKYTLPIQGRLYPSHYSLLYYIKGEKANTFHPDRLPMGVCPKCYGDIKDYGGYKSKMNPKGINLTDVWNDIPPVRHSKFKGRKDANELSIKLLDRIIEMSTEPNDLIFDPFGGSGTTYIVSELKQRKWMGIEIGSVEDILKRFENIEEERGFLEKYRENYNTLFPEKVKKMRIKKGLWVDETFQKDKTKNQNSQKRMF